MPLLWLLLFTSLYIAADLWQGGAQRPKLCHGLEGVNCLMQGVGAVVGLLPHHGVRCKLISAANVAG
jgi:hypothetical protein